LHDIQATARIERDAIETKRKSYITYVTDEIMTHVPDMGVTLFLPHLQMKESQNMNKKITECADKCELLCKEKKIIQLSPDLLEVLYFECLNPLSGQILQQLYEKDILACAWKLADTDIRPAEEVIGKFVKMIAEPTIVPADESSDVPETTIPPLLANFEIQVKARRSSAVSIMVTNESAVQETPEVVSGDNQEVNNAAETVVEDEIVTISIPGVWTPVNKRANAALIYLYFRPVRILFCGIYLFYSYQTPF
jgi:thioredoxin domain-containing protein 3